MSPEEFKENWNISGEATSPMTASDLSGLGLNAQSTSFLSIAGLPESAAPCLSFAERGGTSSYCVRLTNLYDFLPVEYDRYISIGSDGAGNPVAIDTGDKDRVVWLDHEDSFEKAYMNSSLRSLAEFLLVYRDFGQMLITTKGQWAFLDADFTHEEFDTMRRKLEQIDPEALMEGHYWEMELRTLLASRKS